MDKLKKMYDSLAECVCAEISQGLANVETHELGEAIDMIKDIAEAMYYKSVTDSMHDPMASQPARLTAEMYANTTPTQLRDMDKKAGRMYYTEPMSKAMPMNMPMKHEEDYKSKFMESHSMADLEKYIEHMSKDVMDMTNGATPEHKTMLKTKMQNLMSKL